MTLPAAEFLRGLLLHVVPRGFMRIRHYGMVVSRHRKQKLARCRELLGVATMAPSQKPIDTRDTDADREALDDTGTELPLARYPICGAPMRIVEILAPRPHDTS